MSSNEHGAMERNVEHLTANILTYYAHKTEQYAGSYGRSKWTPEYAKLRGPR